MLPRSEYDPNQPQGSMSLANLRNSLRALFESDFMPLRCVAKIALDVMEYATTAAAASAWSGTGVTVTATSAANEFIDGSYSVKCVIDGTNNRQVSHTHAISLSAFEKVQVWTRCSATSSAIQFFVRDGSGNESYWNITTHGTANTWKQDEKTLASPDANSGTPASLASITSYGFRLLDNSVSYWFDAIYGVVGRTVAVTGADQASFYRPVWLGTLTPLTLTTQAAPLITVPGSNPRISLLTINSSGTLAWTYGAEAASPTPPNCPSGLLPLCYVYSRTTMTKVLGYADKDTDANQGYILADVRPWLNLGSQAEILSGTDASKPGTFSANRFYWATDTFKLYFDNGSTWTDITAQFAGFVRLTGNQTIAGIKTFTDTPVCANTPTLADQLTRKGYVDTGLAGKLDTGLAVLLAGAQTVAGVKTFSSIPVLPGSDPTAANEAVRKSYVDGLIAGQVVADASVSVTGSGGSWQDVVSLTCGVNGILDFELFLDNLNFSDTLELRVINPSSVAQTMYIRRTRVRLNTGTEVYEVTRNEPQGTAFTMTTPETDNRNHLRMIVIGGAAGTWKLQAQHQGAAPVPTLLVPLAMWHR